MADEITQDITHDAVLTTAAKGLPPMTAAGSYANVQVTFQQAADGTPFTMESYSFPRPDNAGVTVADAYTLLKTLPEYADAVCV